MGSTKAMNAARAQAITEPGYYKDSGDGRVRRLFLQVTRSVASNAGPNDVARSWVFRYVSPISKRSRYMGLGSLNDVGVAKARELAKAARDKIIAGLDPLDERERERVAKQLAKAKEKTFADVVTEYLADRPDGQNLKHAKQVADSLTTATKSINSLPVNSIDTQLVLSVLRPTWKRATESTKRLRSRIEAVLDYATVNTYRSGDNPARWRGHLEHVLKEEANKSQKHHASMPYVELPAFMKKLRSRDCISARALEFLILTATRTGEAIGARFDEIDMATKTWTVPAARMKARREHRIPLSSRCIEIIKALPPGEFLFPGARGATLSPQALYEFLQDIRRDQDFTTHGFRSAYKDWSDSRNFPDDLSEIQLAHKDRNPTRAAYKRSDRLEDRAKMMEAWSTFCAGSTGEVVPINQRREAVAVS
jgi:integrase